MTVHDPTSPALDVPATETVDRRRALPASRRNLLLLVAVGAFFTLGQIIVVRPSFGLHWDEAVYLSQFDPTVPDGAWSVVRSWGMPLIAAPVAVFGPPLVVIRLYFMILAGIGIVLSFRPWLKVHDSVAVALAALLFSTGWATIYHGSLAYPNFYSALGAVAAVGYFLQARQAGGSLRPVIWLGLSLAFVSLVRPSDGLWLGVPLGLSTLVFREWRRWSVLAAVAGGVVFGWVIWLGEAFLEGSTPIQKFRSASNLVSGGLHFDLRVARLYAGISGNKLSCWCAKLPVEDSGRVWPLTYVWYATAAALVVVAVVAAVRARPRRLAPTLVPLAAALSLGFQFLFVLNYAYMRFVLPVFALLAIPVANGLVHLAESRRGKRLSAGPPVVVGLIVLAHIAVQAPLVVKIVPPARGRSAVLTELGREIQQQGVVAPCYVDGQVSPVITYFMGCARSSTTNPVYLKGPTPPLEAAMRAGQRVAVLTPRTPPADSYLNTWRLVRPDVRGYRKWRIYLPPDQPTGPR